MKASIVMMVLMASSVMAGSVEDYEKRQSQEFVSAVGKADSKLSEAQRKRDAEVKVAIQKYVGALMRLKTAYTKAGNLEKAIEKKNEIAKYQKMLSSGDRDVRLPKPKKEKKPEKVDVEKALGYKLKWHPFGAKRGPNGHYYAFVKGLHTWDEAKEKAKKMGGYLATITTKKEFEFVCTVEKPGLGNKQGGIFVGAKTNGSKELTWITGEETEEDVPVHVLPARYNCISIRTDSGSPKLSGQYGSGRNGTGVKMVKGFIVEWEK